MSEFQKNCPLRQIEHCGPHIVRLSLEAPEMAAAVRPGQFVMAACGHGGGEVLLRRPLSVHDRTSTGCIQLLFRIVGKGTDLLARTRIGEQISLLGPLGRGFALEESGLSCVVGGGMGIAPLLFLARELAQQGHPPLALLGAEKAEDLGLFAQAFHALGCEVHLSTDNGSLGHHGRVTELLPQVAKRLKKMYVCGPMPMMAAAAHFCRERGLACEVSLETHMACGLGACLGCAVPIPGQPGAYRHVCKDGPVFLAEEVLWP